MGSSLWTTLSLALGDSAPGVPSTGPIQIMFMFGPPEPKGCSLDTCRPKCCMGRSQQSRNKDSTCTRHPHFSGEHVEAEPGTGLMSLRVHVVLQASQGTLLGSASPSQHRLLTTVPTCSNSEAAPQSDEEFGLWNQT